MYSHNQMTEELIKQRIVEQVDLRRFEGITKSTLEGLAKKELNLSAIVGKSAEAKERRLVPEVIEDFFLNSAPMTGLAPKPVKAGAKTYKLGRVPRNLWPTGEAVVVLASASLGASMGISSSTRNCSSRTPLWNGSPLATRCLKSCAKISWARVTEHLKRGAVFYDLQSKLPFRLDVFGASIRDGRGNVLSKRLFVVQTDMNGQFAIRQPTIFLDLTPAETPQPVPDDAALPNRNQVEVVLLERALNPLLEESRGERGREISVISRHIELSLNAIINRETRCLPI